MESNVSNTRISTLVESQVPSFVKNDHRNFIKFLEAYYEYLEQHDKTINRAKNLLRYQDIDQTIDIFADKLYETFMKFIPDDIAADKKLLIKHIKDFYRAKGTEKGTRFLLRALYNMEIKGFYYPKKDILIASDGKWFIQQSIRVGDIRIGGTLNTSPTSLNLYTGTQIRGNTSNATALVERVDKFYEQGTLINELIISNVRGNFSDGEIISTTYQDSLSSNTISSTIYSGVINFITITNPGSQYSIGDPVIFVSNTGSDACAIVSSVTTGNVAAISVINGGSGFRSGDRLLFSGGSGTGANAEVSVVVADSSIHPNTYTIISSQLSLEANTLLNAVFSNLNSSNVNTSIINAVSTWSYSNTGPISTIHISNPGQNYVSIPNISVVPNTAIFNLGILGRMEILDGGSGYIIGDKIEFDNVFGGYGFGASAEVTNIDESNSNTITEVKFIEQPGQIIGGAGYSMDYLPIANVSSNTGSGANIIVTSILGAGGDFAVQTSDIGAIENIQILDRGIGYDTNTVIDLTGSGDGLATATVTVIRGVYSYPGRFLNDDGFLSAYNFLQDRDYYQPFSYVIQSDKGISVYKQAIMELNHIAGTKFFGEFVFIPKTGVTCNNFCSMPVQVLKGFESPFTKTSNTIIIYKNNHGLSDNTKVLLDFTNLTLEDGIFLISNTSANQFEITYTNPMYYYDLSGNVEVTII